VPAALLMANLPDSLAKSLAGALDIGPPPISSVA
jgi:hypothetical protein